MAKRRLVKAEPLPTCKWKIIVSMIQQDVEVPWIAGITFSKSDSGVKNGENFIFRNDIENV